MGRSICLGTCASGDHVVFVSGPPLMVAVRGHPLVAVLSLGSLPCLRCPASYLGVESQKVQRELWNQMLRHPLPQPFCPFLKADKEDVCF